MLRPLMLLALLATAQAARAGEATVVVVVRHAEKAADDPRDPALSAAGAERAQALARSFDGAGLDAAYATQFRRARDTAAPAAAAAGIAVALRPIDAGNARTYAPDLAREIRALPAGSTVLVVGHSNTVPGLVRALSGQDAAAMPETEYDRYTVVVLDGDSARVVTGRY